MDIPRTLAEQTRPADGDKPFFSSKRRRSSFGTSTHGMGDKGPRKGSSTGPVFVWDDDPVDGRGFNEHRGFEETPRGKVWGDASKRVTPRENVVVRRDRHGVHVQVIDVCPQAHNLTSLQKRLEETEAELRRCRKGKSVALDDT